MHWLHESLSGVSDSDLAENNIYGEFLCPLIMQWSTGLGIS